MSLKKLIPYAPPEWELVYLTAADIITTSEPELGEWDTEM